MIVANPLAGHPKGRGLEVAQWLLGQHIDVAVTPDDIRDSGPGHALCDAGIVQFLLLVAGVGTVVMLRLPHGG
jgi:hypothetical protein